MLSGGRVDLCTSLALALYTQSPSSYFSSYAQHSTSPNRSIPALGCRPRRRLADQPRRRYRIVSAWVTRQDEGIARRTRTI